MSDQFASIASALPASALKNWKADYRDFFESGSIALHMVGGDGTILHANEAELKLLGYPIEEYIGHHISEFHADRPVLEDILARLKKGEKLDKYAARLRARDGSIKYVEISSSGLFHNGDFVSTRCFTVDVSDLQHVRDALRAKDEQIRFILDSLPAAVYTTDAQGKITYYNQAAVELAGREPQIGEDEWCVTFRLLTPDGKPMSHAECPMATALKENRPVRGVEALAQRPDGTIVPFLPFPTPLHNEAGELVGAVNMLIDISQRKQSEAHQRILLDELNHRVKNNMQMLHGLLEAALRETESAEAKAVIGDASQRVAAMAAAQQLLYADKTPRSFAIGDFLDAVSASARQAFPENVSVHIDAADGHLSNDVSMPLALILNELLTNAAKYGVNRSVGGRIDISLTRDDGFAVLAVKDDGAGFDLVEARKRSSGLGLVAGLTRQLGGTFTVERAPGARCIVRFPERPIS